MHSPGAAPAAPPRAVPAPLAMEDLPPFLRFTPVGPPGGADFSVQRRQRRRQFTLPERLGQSRQIGRHAFGFGEA